MPVITYHQIKIDKIDVQKSVFSTKSGHSEFVRMPFSLSSATTILTKSMKFILMGLEKVCTAYLDDIVVHESRLRDQQTKLGQVFNRLRIHNLKLQSKKCVFIRKEVVYLGHVINEIRVQLNVSKITQNPKPQGT